MIARRKLLKIDKAEHAGEYRLMLSFSDGKEQTVDFGPFLENSRNPEIRKFLKPKNFKSFKLEDGDLMWGDFDLIFPIMDLYENRLEHGLSEVAGAVSKPRT